MKAKVNRQEAVSRPEVIWNGFIHVLAMSERKDLASIQVAPHLAFWYDSEVQNGGHLQYFLNKGLGQARDALDALQLLGADAQRAILVEAIEIYERSDASRWQVESDEDYSSLAMEGPFDEQDAAYYDCAPEMTDLLQRYLDSHTDDFIEFTDQPVSDPFVSPTTSGLLARIRRLLQLT